MSNSIVQQQKVLPYYNFFVYSDTGSCIYKILSSTNKEDDIGAMQGIIQALFFTSNDLNCNINILSTELGVLSFKHYQYKDNTILLVLIFPNYFGDENICELITRNLLDFIYHALVIHIGITDLFSFKTSNDIEKLRRYIEVFEKTILYLIENYSSLSLLLKAERKYELEKDAIYSIKYYLEKVKVKLKVDLICLTARNNIVWASSDWLSIDITDRLLFLIITELYGNNDYNEIPIYFSSTLLEDEGLGKIPYKLLSINLMRDIKMLILSDNELKLSSIDLSVFDDFFVSRLINMKSITSFNNEVLEQNAKSIVVHNRLLKTFKIMINDGESETFEKFILNSPFCDAIFNPNTIYDEFYIKNENNLTFYYYRAEILTFLILFEKDTTFDDINSVKMTLKNLKDSFDNRENYKDTADLKN